MAGRTTNQMAVRMAGRDVGYVGKYIELALNNCERAQQSLAIEAQFGDAALAPYAQQLLQLQQSLRNTANLAAEIDRKALEIYEANAAIVSHHACEVLA